MAQIGMILKIFKNQYRYTKIICFGEFLLVNKQDAHLNVLCA